MYRSLFKLIGAFTLWTLSGFKGKYESHMDGIESYTTALVGGLTVFVLLMVTVFTIRFIQN
jgi:hypothetical protein